MIAAQIWLRTLAFLVWLAQRPPPPAPKRSHAVGSWNTFPARASPGLRRAGRPSMPPLVSDVP